MTIAKDDSGTPSLKTKTNATVDSNFTTVGIGASAGRKLYMAINTVVSARFTTQRDPRHLDIPVVSNFANGAAKFSADAGQSWGAKRGHAFHVLAAGSISREMRAAGQARYQFV